MRRSRPKPSVVLIGGLLAAVPVVANGSDWPYAVIELEGIGPTSGGTAVTAINDRGVAAGRDGTMLFRYEDGAIVDLPWTWQGITGIAWANDVNETGLVVGHDAGDGLDDNWFYTGWIWDSDGTVLRQQNKAINGINERGSLAMTSGWGSLDQGSTWHAFLGNLDGTEQYLGTLGGDFAACADINEHDVIVGWSDDPDGTRHAFRWSPAEGMVDLGRPDPFDETAAAAVNDHAVVVGDATVYREDRRAVRWDAAGTMRELGGLPGRPFTRAHDINNAGMIIGVAGDTPSIGNARPWRWTQRTGMTDLNTLIPPLSSWSLFDAGSINQRGIIGASASQPDIEGTYPVVLVPVKSELSLQGPSPGHAGEVNTFRIAHATPAARVVLAYGFTGGGAEVPGCDSMAGQVLQIEHPIVTASTRADDEGVGTIQIFIPAKAWEYGDILVQAFAPDTCEISNLVLTAFE